MILLFFNKERILDYWCLVFENNYSMCMDKERDFEYFKMYKYFNLIFGPKL